MRTGAHCGVKTGGIAALLYRRQYVRLEAFDRARHRQELRRYTDLELILSGRQLRYLIENGKTIVSPCRESPSAWELQMEDAMAEWRTRQESRRTGVCVCLCHAPGSQVITPNAQMWKESGYDTWLARRLTPNN